MCVLLLFVLDPVKEDSTIYDAFNAGDSRSASNTSGGNAANDKRAAQAPNKKKKPEQNGKGGSGGKHMSLEAALAQVQQPVN
jgi:hypothetical protein